MPGPPKLIVSLREVPRGADLNTTLIHVNDKDPLAIIDGPEQSPTAWDSAHIAVKSPGISFAEPEVDSAAPYYSRQQEVIERREPVKEDYQKFIDYWPHPDKPFIWHLGLEHTQLKQAKETVAQLPSKKVVRIAHLDTGYDANHQSLPAKELIRHDLERNFVEGEEDRWNNAEDNFSEGTLNQPGHGTGTLSILAGTRMSLEYCGFDDYFGLYDSIEIVPIRISKSVVLFKSGAFVRAMDYIVNELSRNDSTRIHIITMSMGGLASRAWADLVNLAYEQGIFMVTAAGNNYKKLPARTLVYPARFNRVVAACGATFDESPYSKLPGEDGFSIMEGNHGPRSLMKTAVAAYTPNVPWATYHFDDMVGIRGDGTSSATPQIASAAALYYIKHYDKLEALPEPWMRVEVIRNALFTSAEKTINGRDGDYEKYYGNGILRAGNMLEKDMPSPHELEKQPMDKVSFPLFKLIFGLRAIDAEELNEEDMLETELMQLVQTNEQLQELLDHEEKQSEELTIDERKRLAQIVRNDNNASMKLRQNMDRLLNQLEL